MAKSLDEPLIKFRQQIEVYSLTWRSIEARVIGAPDDAGHWKLLGLEAQLSYQEASGTEIVFESPSLVMLTYSVGFTWLDTLLSSLQAGRVVMDEREFDVDGFTRYDCTESRSRSGLEDSLTFPYVLLYSHGKSVLELVDEGEIRRMLLRWGEDSLSRASEDKLGYPVGDNHSTRVRIIAPIYVEADCVIDQGRLIVTLSHHEAIPLDDITGSFEATSASLSRLVKSSLSFHACDNGLDHPFCEARAEVNIDGEIVSARAWVFYRSRPEPLITIHVSKPVGANAQPVLTALGMLLKQSRQGRTVSGEEILRQYLGLEGDSSSSDKFELAVLNLLTSQGFLAGYTGKGVGSRGVDIILQSPDDGNVIALSCTLSNNILDKVRNLVPVLNSLRKEYGHQRVSGAIVSPIPRADVLESDAQVARAQYITLVLQEEVERLYRIVTSMVPKDAREPILGVFGKSKAFF